MHSVALRILTLIALPGFHDGIGNARKLIGYGHSDQYDYLVLFKILLFLSHLTLSLLLIGKSVKKPMNG